AEGRILDVNCKNADGLTPLLLVTRNVDLFEKLNKQLHKEYNPLEVVAELLTHSGDPDVFDSEGKNPLHYASLCKTPLAGRLVSCMLEEGVESGAKDRRCNTPIHCASRSGNVDVMLALIDGGMDVNVRGFAGATPLHVSAQTGNNDTATTLLEYGADVTLVDDKGLTAVDVAKNKRVRSTLKEAWAEATQKKPEPQLGPLRAPSRESSHFSQDELRTFKAQKRKGEVIFDGLPITSSFQCKKSFSPPKKLTLQQLSEAHSAMKHEEQVLKELETGTFSYSPTRDGPRILGTPRGVPKPSTLPRMPHSPEKTPLHKSPERHLAPLREAQSQARKLSREFSADDFESGHPILGKRNSDPGRKLSPLNPTDSDVSIKGRATDLSETLHDLRSKKIVHGTNLARQRRLSDGSNHSPSPNIAELTGICDDLLSKGRSPSVVSVGDLDIETITPPPRLTPIRTPSGSDRNRLKIPNTIQEDKETRAMILDLDQMGIKTSSDSPVFQDLYPLSRKILPPSPLQQKQYSFEEGRLTSQDFASSKESSPRSTESSPRSDCSSSHDIKYPVRSKSILRNVFNIEESRTVEHRSSPESESKSSMASSSFSSMTTPSPETSQEFGTVNTYDTNSSSSTLTNVTINANVNARGASSTVTDKGNKKPLHVPRPPQDKERGEGNSAHKSVPASKNQETKTNKVAQNIAANKTSISMTESSKKTSKTAVTSGDNKAGSKAAAAVAGRARLREVARQNAQNPAVKNVQKGAAVQSNNSQQALAVKVPVSSAMGANKKSSPPRDKIIVHSNILEETADLPEEPVTEKYKEEKTDQEKDASLIEGKATAEEHFFITETSVKNELTSMMATGQEKKECAKGNSESPLKVVPLSSKSETDIKVTEVKMENTSVQDSQPVQKMLKRSESDPKLKGMTRQTSTGSLSSNIPATSPRSKVLNRTPSQISIVNSVIISDHAVQSQKKMDTKPNNSPRNNTQNGKSVVAWSDSKSDKSPRKTDSKASTALQGNQKNPNPAVVQAVNRNDLTVSSTKQSKTSSPKNPNNPATEKIQEKKGPKTLQGNSGNSKQINVETNQPHSSSQQVPQVPGAPSSNKEGASAKVDETAAFNSDKVPVERASSRNKSTNVTASPLSKNVSSTERSQSVSNAKAIEKAVKSVDASQTVGVVSKPKVKNTNETVYVTNAKRPSDCENIQSTKTNPQVKVINTVVNNSPKTTPTNKGTKEDNVVEMKNEDKIESNVQNSLESKVTTSGKDISPRTQNTINDSIQNNVDGMSPRTQNQINDKIEEISERKPVTPVKTKTENQNRTRETLASDMQRKLVLVSSEKYPEGGVSKKPMSARPTKANNTVNKPPVKTVKPTKPSTVVPKGGITKANTVTVHQKHFSASTKEPSKQSNIDKTATNNAKVPASNIQPSETKAPPQTDNKAKMGQDILQMENDQKKTTETEDEKSTPAPGLEVFVGKDQSPDLPKAVRVNFVEHTGPVIEDAFENFPKPYETQSVTSAANNSALDTKNSTLKPPGRTRDAFFSAQNRSPSKTRPKKSAVVKSQNQTSKTTGQQGTKKVGNKNNTECKKDGTDGQKVKKRLKSGKKKKKKQVGKTELYNIDPSKTALISGIGWHIATDKIEHAEVSEKTDSSDEESETPRPSTLNPGIAKTEGAEHVEPQANETTEGKVPPIDLGSVANVCSTEKTEPAPQKTMRPLEVPITLDSMAMQVLINIAEFQSPRTARSSRSKTSVRSPRRKSPRRSPRPDEIRKVLEREIRERSIPLSSSDQESPVNSLIPNTINAIRQFAKSVRDDSSDDHQRSESGSGQSSGQNTWSSSWEKKRENFSSKFQPEADAALENMNSSLKQSSKVVQSILDEAPGSNSDTDGSFPDSRHEGSMFSAGIESNFSSRQSSGSKVISSGSSRQSSNSGSHDSANSRFLKQLEELRQSSGRVSEAGDESQGLSRTYGQTSDNNVGSDQLNKPIANAEKDENIEDLIEEILSATPVPREKKPKSNTSSPGYNSNIDSHNTSVEDHSDEVRHHHPHRRDSKEVMREEGLEKLVDNFKKMELQVCDDGTTPTPRRSNSPAMPIANSSHSVTKRPPSGRSKEVQKTSSHVSSSSPISGRRKKMTELKQRASKDKPELPSHRSDVSEMLGEVPTLTQKDIDAMSECSGVNSDLGSEWLSVTGSDADDDAVNQSLVQVMKEVEQVTCNSPESRTYTSRLGRRSNTRAESVCSTRSEGETLQWKKGNVLGKGAFGTVWCGLTDVGELIAVKQINLNVHDMDKAEKEYEKIQEEVDLLKTLKHKNIVGYLGTSLEDDTVNIFMQFVPGGSVANLLARFGALEEVVFCRYTKQILEGVEYLHANNVIHRDIKGANIMLMPNGIIKLIDFGCAKRLCINLSMSQTQILKSMKGTPYWMAPEVVTETGHGKKSDIWSIGCTVFEMATRKPPWSEMAPMAAIFAIGSDKPVPELPATFSEEAREFVKMCMLRDQDLRWDASALLQHIFITKKKK
ncbi:ankyrin repeat domain-containing protein 12, partial [Lingula anatina]|uniref:Mitogen-activated protein kinase kinase kinase 19 n=1 Tax=Lingula anatina TaxID=7574 RepID=A0A1S3JNP8_LINAN